MKSKIFIGVLILFSFVIVAQTSNAIYLAQDTSVTAQFYSEYKTDVLGIEVTNFSTDPTQTVQGDTYTDLTSGGGTNSFGSAYGSFSNVNIDSTDYGRFKFETLSNITAPVAGDAAYSASATVKNVDGRIKLDIDPSAGENPGYVTLSARSKLHGNIIGQMLGTAHFYLAFQVWDAPVGGNLLLEITQDQTADGSPANGMYQKIDFDNDTLFPMVTESSAVVLDTDDSIYISFTQVLETKTAASTMFSSGSGALTYSLEDIYGTVFLDFTDTGGSGDPTPEPASFLLLGIGLLGFGLSDKIKRMLQRNLMKS